MMFKKTILVSSALLLVAGLLAIFPVNAYAADDAVGADKKMATSEGLATKEFDQSKLPGKMEIGLTIGSIIAVIATVKYL